jgi:sugar/nucleoside kinase (ribokinase family)
MAKNDLLVVGELNVDLILNGIQGFPQIGKEIVANDLTLTLGSSSAIMAANAAALGVSTAFGGMVGSDQFGDYILETLEDRNVSTAFVRRSDSHQTGVTVVMNYDEDRANVTYCGAMEAMTILDIPWFEMSNFKHFHLSNFFLQKGLHQDITAIFKKVKGKGLTTSLDLQWDPADEWNFDYKECLPYIDVFMPNEAEILRLTQTNDVENALKQVEPYANTIALKMGSKGSLGIKNGERVQTSAFKADVYVDSIGAGDSFNAGFIAKYLQGAELGDCLLNGNLMGAINTTMAGGTEAFKDKKALQKKIEQLQHTKTTS